MRALRRCEWPCPRVDTATGAVKTSGDAKSGKETRGDGGDNVLIIEKLKCTLTVTYPTFTTSAVMSSFFPPLYTMSKFSVAASEYGVVRRLSIDAAYAADTTAPDAFATACLDSAPMPLWYPVPLNDFSTTLRISLSLKLSHSPSEPMTITSPGSNGKVVSIASLGLSLASWCPS